jgi:hypothetical protein
MTELRKMLTYIVQGTLKHDGQTWKHGSEFRHPDQELCKNLHQTGAIKLPSEVAPPEDVAVQLAQAQDENSRLQEELDRMNQRIAQAAQEKLDKLSKQK